MGQGPTVFFFFFFLGGGGGVGGGSGGHFLKFNGVRQEMKW